GGKGALLIGVDLKKDEATLNAAYNDAAGITAAFNLNLLEHLNREFDATFNSDNFEHLARYNPEEGCVQMFLVSRADQVFTVAGERLSMKRGERIHTENSHKYSKDEFLDMASRAGF
ncbi:MAG: L-histidine N(alpha)-methyltransferase, partial [Pseudomonadales bacterium]|nr:L-histidine N(alpha)-methyltransferase [Pseudomonadales bacterium]